MKKFDLISIIVLLILAACFGAAGINEYFHQNEAKPYMNNTYEIVNASCDELIGDVHEFRGNPNAPYTLVEFGDYECPPCKFACKTIESALRDNSGKLRFAFRNLPLYTIHPFAMRAAQIAEYAREKGNFWSIHDRLFSLKVLNDASINQIIKNENIPVEKLNNISIDKDVNKAKKMNIAMTPSFLLCCPDNKVIHLQSLDELHVLLK